MRERDYSLKNVWELFNKFSFTAGMLKGAMAKRKKEKW
jgi:hypothetical protein